MKRILITQNDNYTMSFDSKKLSYFQVQMFNGDTYFNLEKWIFVKNLYKRAHVIQPSWSFVVSDLVFNLLDKFADIKLEKILDYKYYYFDYFRENTNEERAFYDSKEVNKSDFYENLEACVDDKVVYYDMSIPEINEYEDGGEVVETVVKGIHPTLNINKKEIPKLPDYNAFYYNEFSFFTNEVFDIIEPYLDKRFFTANEVVFLI